MNIERRIQKVEESLNIDGPPVVMQIVMFGGGLLPPDERRGSITVRHVHYESIRVQPERAGRP